MESSTTRTAENKRHQEEILKEIEVLKAKLKTLPAEAHVTRVPPPTSPKRKCLESAALVPPTPSPKKRKLNHRPPHITKYGGSSAPPSECFRASTASSRSTAQPDFAKPATSNLLKNLASATRGEDNTGPDLLITRSSGFTERPATPVTRDNRDPFCDSSGLKRDERLGLIEELEPGPFDHTPPAGDPNFDTLEPNSGIRLSGRTVSHADLQEHLTGRFYLSPSQLYSNVRLLPNKLGYDVPVPGDWITIAVVAERGPLKYTKAPIAIGREEGDETEKKCKGKGKANEETAKPAGKKFVNLKLIDFGSRSSSSATGGKAVIRGDAFLSLLLFESDTFDLVAEDGESKPRRVYKGGSRGAFESMSKLKEGDVIALLNPRILKPHQVTALFVSYKRDLDFVNIPFQGANNTPHPVNNVLAITPESASSIIGIGRARDLGMCSVRKRDNSICGSWVDKRVSDACEYHIQHAVERRRAGRAEFSIGTTGMSTSSAPRRKSVYDPARQWGLRPEPTANSATYIVSGHVVNDSGVDARSLFTTENMGREGQAKAARRVAKKATDRTLASLLERDKEGMKPVMKALEVGKHGADALKATKESGNVKAKGKVEKVEALPTGKNAYTADVIKQLGFDPIALAGQRRGAGNQGMQKKLRSLEALQASRKNIILTPRPGQRIRSGVVAPDKNTSKEGILHDLDSSGDELLEQLSGQKSGDMMIDLDSDD
ncbi:hypothetical protein H0H87_008647 [Tephrocybe sp. NHM501043]|nr:hypothetical protein H0H87_008647 [Tephrocybe sp. NHM501043]